MRIFILIVLGVAIAWAFNSCEVDEAPQPIDESIIGAQFEPYTRAKQFSEDYEEQLDKQRQELDDQIDGG